MNALTTSGHARSAAPTTLVLPSVPPLPLLHDPTAPVEPHAQADTTYNIAPVKPESKTVPTDTTEKPKKLAGLGFLLPHSPADTQLVSWSKYVQPLRRRPLRPHPRMACLTPEYKLRFPYFFPHTMFDLRPTSHSSSNHLHAAILTAIESSILPLIVCIQDGIVGIYDPSYVVTDKETRQLRGLKGMTLVTKFLNTLKKSYKLIGEAFVSGGGNDGSQCNEMCRRWLVDQLITQGGSNIGKWQEMGWDMYRAN